MAGWVCQTRKLLQSAIATIADELEQTVQDFNDAVHNLSRPHESTGQEQTAAIGGKEETPQDKRASSQPPPRRPKCNISAIPIPHTNNNTEVHDQEFFGRAHSVPTTRQPETIGFSSTLNSRLSQSSPSLCQIKLFGSRSPDWSQARRSSSSVSRLHSHASRSSKHSSLSASSPCLVHISRSSRKAKPTLATIHLETPEVGSRSSESCNERSQNTQKKPLQLSHSCPCHRQSRSKNIACILDQRRPGKVIRASRSVEAEDVLDVITTEDEAGISQELKSHDVEESRSERGPNSSADPQGGVMVKSSTSFLVETEPHFMRWMTLRPITRVLSFALSQFANVILMLTDDDRQNNSAIQSSSYDRLTLTNNDNSQISQIHSPDVAPGAPSIQRSMSVDSTKETEGKDSLYASLLRSTYSTESFEIIETSCFEELPQSGSQSSPQSSFAHRRYDDNSSPTQNFVVVTQTVCRPHNSTVDVLSSSAEFVNFDFRDLIANRQFDKLNPVSVSSESVQRAPTDRGEDMYKSYVVIADKEHDIVVTYTDEGCDENEAGRPDDDCEVNDEDDDDGSVSFTILSENDEEFIMF